MIQTGAWCICQSMFKIRLTLNIYLHKSVIQINISSLWCFTLLLNIHMKSDLLNGKTEMEKGLMNGKFTFKTLPDGSVDRTKVICPYCRQEMSYHWSMSTLKYHLQTKRMADAETSTTSPQTSTTNSQTTKSWSLVLYNRSPDLYNLFTWSLHLIQWTSKMCSLNLYN